MGKRDARGASSLRAANMGRQRRPRHAPRFPRPRHVAWWQLAQRRCGSGPARSAHLLLLGQDGGGGQARHSAQLAGHARAGDHGRPPRAARPRQAHHVAQVVPQVFEPVPHLAEGQAAGQARRAATVAAGAAAVAAARAAHAAAAGLIHACGEGGREHGAQHGRRTVDRQGSGATRRAVAAGSGRSGTRGGQLRAGAPQGRAPPGPPCAPWGSPRLQGGPLGSGRRTCVGHRFGVAWRGQLSTRRCSLKPPCRSDCSVRRSEGVRETPVAGRQAPGGREERTRLATIACCWGNGGARRSAGFTGLGLEERSRVAQDGVQAPPAACASPSDHRRPSAQLRIAAAALAAALPKPCKPATPLPLSPSLPGHAGGRGTMPCDPCAAQPSMQARLEPSVGGTLEPQRGQTAACRAKLLEAAGGPMSIDVQVRATAWARSRWAEDMAVPTAWRRRTKCRRRRRRRYRSHLGAPRC